jgi:hypothetical protein
MSTDGGHVGWDDKNRHFVLLIIDISKHRAKVSQFKANMA